MKPYLFNVIRTPRWKRPDMTWLTPAESTATSMAVHWMADERNVRRKEIIYRKQGDSSWIQTYADIDDEMPWEGTATLGDWQEPDMKPKRIHIAVLGGLESDTIYEFRVAGESVATTKRFKTFKNDPSDMRVVGIGDMQNFQPWWLEINQIIPTYNPDLIVGGGDYVGSEGGHYYDHGRGHRWINFLSPLEKDFVRSDGCMIPLALPIGHHEISGQPYGDPAQARYFGKLFHAPGRIGEVGYFWCKLEFGSLLQLFILDMAHTNDANILSQTTFLQNNINPSFAHILPTHHNSHFQSVKDFFSGTVGDISSQAREQWLPILYDNGAKLLHTGDEHNYCVRHPIAYNPSLPDGVDENEYVTLFEPDGETIKGYLYRDDTTGMVEIGDGGWGTNRRDIFNPETTWWINRGEGVETRRGKRHVDGVSIEDAPVHADDGEPGDDEKTKHFYVLDFDTAKVRVRAVTHLGNVFDDFNINV